jgi:uncharacterized protein
MNCKPDANHITTAVKKMIDEKCAMTLATASRHVAWAAPVYYVFNKNCFYFFSNPESRHIRETLKSGQAAAAIYEESAQWQGLKGIQMSGKIDDVPPGTEAVTALNAYVQKFQLIRSFFSDMVALNLNGIFTRFQVKLYRFTPEFIYYMDNSIHFGFREEIQLQTLNL